MILVLRQSHHTVCHFDEGEISKSSSTKIGLLERSYLRRFLLRRNDKIVEITDYLTTIPIAIGSKELRKERKVSFLSKRKGSQRLILKSLRTLRMSLRSLRLNNINENDLLQSQIRHLFPRFPFRRVCS